MEGSSEVSENSKHEGPAHAVGQSRPGTSRDPKWQMQFTLQHLPPVLVVDILLGVGGLKSYWIKQKQGWLYTYRYSHSNYTKCAFKTRRFNAMKMPFLVI